MSETPGSTVVRRRLGGILKGQREALKLSVRDVAAVADLSGGQISKIENGNTAVRAKDVRELRRVYMAKLTGDELASYNERTELLAELALGTTQKNWWEGSFSAGAVPQFMTLYVSLEEITNGLTIVSPSVIPGLVQTEEYAQAYLSTAVKGTPDELVNERLAFRMGRQRLIESRQVPVTVLLGPGALLLEVGAEGRSRSIMRRQLDHLRALDADPKRPVTVEVVPWSIGAHPMPGATFTHMTFDETEDPTTAFVELPRGALYVEDSEELTYYENQITQLREHSIPIGDYTP